MYHVNIPYQYNISTQRTLSTHPLNTPFPCTVSIYLLNEIDQYTPDHYTFDELILFTESIYTPYITLA